MANVGHRLTEIDVYRPSTALAQIMLSPSMGAFLTLIGTEVALRYTAKVAKRTGQLAASPRVSTPIGGQKHDRLVGKVTVGGELAVAEWHSERNPNPGGEFYYGVLHNFGSPTKKARFPAHDDLKEVMETM